MEETEDGTDDEEGVPEQQEHFEKPGVGFGDEVYGFLETTICDGVVNLSGYDQVRWIGVWLSGGGRGGGGGGGWT